MSTKTSVRAGLLLAFALAAFPALAIPTSVSPPSAGAVQPIVAPSPFLVTQYGALCNDQQINDATIASGSLSQVSSASYTFTSADVGKQIGIIGAGAAATVGRYALNTTIASVSGGVATLTTAASVAVSGATADFGTDDTAAIQSAVNAAGASTLFKRQAEVVLPRGVCVIGGTITWPAATARVAFRGQEEWESGIVYLSATGATGAAFYGVTGGTGGANAHNWTDLSFRDFFMDGTYYNISTGYNSSYKAIYFQYLTHLVIDHVATFGWQSTCIGTDYIVDGHITNNYTAKCGRGAAASGQNPDGITHGSAPGASGIGIGTNSALASENFEIIGNIDYDSFNNGIFIETQQPADGVGHYVIANNEVFKVTSPGPGIADSGNALAVITGNRVIMPSSSSSKGCGIQTDTGSGSSTVLSQGGQISNNSVTGGYGGICVFAGAAVANANLNYTISNNVTTGAYGPGIDIEGPTSATAYTLSGIKILGNFSYGNGGAGVNFNSVNGAFSDVTIQNFQAYDNGTNSTIAAYAHAGVAFSSGAASSNITLSGVVARDRGVTKQTYGVSINTGTTITNFNMQGSTLSGVTSAFNNAGTLGAGSIVAGNVGVNPVGTLAAITPSSSPYTYTAGASPTTLYVSGGTVTGITRNGVNIGMPSQINLPPNGSAVITYSAAPTVVPDVQ